MAENYDVPNIEGLEALPQHVRDLFYEDPDAQDEHGYTVIRKHVSGNVYYPIITPNLMGKARDLDIKDNLGRTALLDAICLRNKFMLEALIEKGASIHTTDNGNCNALHYITVGAIRDKNGLMEAPSARHPITCLLPLFESFLEKGIDVNLQTDLGVTALILAAAGQILKIVKLLLKYGANVHLKDAHSRTCLHMASTPTDWNKRLWDEPNSDIITELIRNGACVNCFDDRGRTPLGCILGFAHRNKDYFARKYLTVASLVHWEIRKDFYILQNRILGALRADGSLVEHVNACYEEICRIKSFQLSERFNLCHFALRGVSDAEESIASEIKDAAFNILVRETFPIYHDFIFSNFQLDYLRQKLTELEIFTYSRGQRFSLVPDVNSLIALSMNINDIFNVLKAFS